MLNYHAFPDSLGHDSGIIEIGAIGSRLQSKYLHSLNFFNALAIRKSVTRLLSKEYDDNNSPI